MQRSEVPVVSGIRVSSVLEKESHNIRVTKGAGIVERNETTYMYQGKGMEHVSYVGVTRNKYMYTYTCTCMCRVCMIDRENTGVTHRGFDR